MMRVTVIGSGFAALEAVRTLRRKGTAQNLELTVISPAAELLYHPSLIWIPSGKRDGSELVVSLEPFFRDMQVIHKPALAVGIRDQGRTVATTAGDVANDGLIIACGGRYLQKLPGIEHTLNLCSGVAAAETMRERLRSMDGGTLAFGFAGNPNDPPAVRGGPLFEFLFGTHTHLRRTGRRERFQLVFFSPMAEPGKRLGPKAVQGLLAAMARKKIATRLGQKILRFEPGQVVLEDGAVAADMILFTPGMGGLPWYAETGLPLSPGGFISADIHCRAQGGERIYVAGDAVDVPGPDWRPKQAHMAELQAHAAATNLHAELTGVSTRVTFRNELICIVDALDEGTLVSRFEKFNLILPPMGIMHGVKELLEVKTLRPYRAR
jgi:sulfide:quinone oxidoreductase